MADTNMNLSFAGCGFLSIYYAGVVAAIKEYAPQLQQNKMSAASAGAIAAASLMCDVNISLSTATYLKIVKEARSRALYALHPAFNLINEVAKSLNSTLPDNAHEICSGRLHISLTGESDHRNVVVSEFESKAELIQAICCSCYIPYYCGREYPAYRGKRYFDGGWSDNQPVYDENTVTVSPFSGESDICPPDLDSANLFGFMFAGTSIRFTYKNLYRLTVCLIPPSMEVCSRICRQGFEDALRFCIKNRLTSDARCVTILSNVNIHPTESSSFIKCRKERMKTKSAIELCKMERSDYMNDEAIGSKVSNQIASLFPDVLRKVIEEADIDNTVLGYLSSFQVFRWFRTATVPVTLPFEIFFLFCKNVMKWLEESDSNWWFAEKLRTVVNFLLKEVECQRARYSARLTCQLAITEIDVTSFDHTKISPEDIELNVKPSVEAEKEFAFFRKRDSQLFERKKNKSTAKVSTSRTDPAMLSDNPLLVDEATRFATAHESVLSYSYINDKDEMRVCEIFDLSRSKKQTCIDSNDSMLEDGQKCKFQLGDVGTDLDDSDEEENGVFTAKKTLINGDPNNESCNQKLGYPPGAENQ